MESSYAAALLERQLSTVDCKVEYQEDLKRGKTLQGTELRPPAPQQVYRLIFYHLSWKLFHKESFILAAMSFFGERMALSISLYPFKINCMYCVQIGINLFI